MILLKQSLIELKAQLNIDIFSTSHVEGISFDLFKHLKLVKVK